MINNNTDTPPYFITFLEQSMNYCNSLILLTIFYILTGDGFKRNLYALAYVKVGIL